MIEPIATGATITVRRRGRPPEIIQTGTLPEAMRVSRRFAEQGFVGLVDHGGADG